MPIISKVPEIVKREFPLEDYVLGSREIRHLYRQRANHVVNSALKMIVLKDKEFASWCKQQNPGARTATPAPRSRQKA